MFAPPPPARRISPCTEGALAGMSGASAATEGAATGLREMGKETLGFSGMGGAVFDGLAALEAVHFSEGGAPGGEGNVEVHRIPCAHLRYTLADRQGRPTQAVYHACFGALSVMLVRLARLLPLVVP